MKKIIFLLLSLPGVMVYGQTSPNEEARYECGQRLAIEEISEYQVNSFSGYTDEEIRLLTKIMTLILETNPEKETYECFFNTSKKNLLVLDVFGLEDYQCINRTLCSLRDDTDIKLPKNTIILFHIYVNGFEDGGIIEALRMVN